jgi:hypothetical protein
MSEAELLEFMIWAQEYLDTKCPASKDIIAPILYGIEGLMEPTSSPWQITPGVSNPMRFLGWSKGGHFLLEKQKVG